MSSTNRNESQRETNYETPRWVVRRLLEAVDIPNGYWLEPTAGNGRIIQEVNADRPGGVIWEAVESRESCIPNLKALPGVRAHLADFRAWDTRAAAKSRKVKLATDASYFDVSILNPPFDITLPILHTCLTCSEEVFLLQRLNWTGSGTNNGKQEFLTSFMPNIYILPNRVSFLIDGKFPRHEAGARDGKGRLIEGRKKSGDSIEYAWFHWPRKAIRPRNAGITMMLAVTPEEERITLEEAA